MEDTLIFANGNGSGNKKPYAIPQRGTTRDQPRRSRPVSLATKLKEETKKDLTPLEWSQLARKIIRAHRAGEDGSSPEKIGQDVINEFMRQCIYQEAKDMLDEFLSGGATVPRDTIRAGSSL